LKLDNFDERIDKMGQAIAPYAKAKAERVYIEQFRKSKKALLMRSDEALALKTVSEREQYAYSHPEYIELLDGLREATKVEEAAKWALERFKIEVEVWRTTSANERWQRDRV